MLSPDSSYTVQKGKDKVCPITGHEDPEGEAEVQFYTFFNLGTRWGWVVNATSWPLYSQERDLVPTVEKAGWAPRPVWMGAENLAPTWISYSLYFTLILGSISF